MKMWNGKQVIMRVIPYLFLALFATHIGEAWRMSEVYEPDLRIMGFMEMLPAAFASVLPSFHFFDLTVGVAVAAALKTAVYLKSLDRKNTGKVLNTVLPVGGQRKTLRRLLIRNSKITSS